MNEVVTLEPWSPWPLVFPVLVLLGGAAVSIIGTRRRNKPLRESGYVAIVFGALAAGAMTYSMSGIWDVEQRTAALPQARCGGNLFAAHAPAAEAARA